ncbi:MAG: hypothetical protein ACFB6S_10855 [Geminicoccaceae bacterium]
MIRWREVQDLASARLALASADDSVELITAPGTAEAWGVGYWAALEEMLGARVWIDCDDRAGLALAALREGCTAIVWRGDPERGRKLAEIAAAKGAGFRQESARERQDDAPGRGKPQASVIEVAQHHKPSD